MPINGLRKRTQDSLDEGNDSYNAFTNEGEKDDVAKPKRGDGERRLAFYRDKNGNVYRSEFELDNSILTRLLGKDRRKNVRIEGESWEDWTQRTGIKGEDLEQISWEEYNKEKEG